jgi:prepilin-type N-terminal cleavage/methylation domain-containing protein
MSKRTHTKSQAGFSLLELLIVCALLTIIMGAIFGQINQGQQTSTAEQMKLDLFQESREFMDQMSRDLRSSGYPNTRNFSADPVSPAEQSPQEAMGLVKLDVGELWFESSIDGSGNVSVIHYDLVQSGTGCPCLTRSQTPKLAADPLTGQTETQQTEVQNVLNGTTANPIFQAYYADGTPVTLPIDITNNTLANVNSVAITLQVQSPYQDPKTGQKPTTTLLSTVRLNNCSVAYPNTSGTVMGCK